MIWFLVSLALSGSVHADAVWNRGWQKISVEYSRTLHRALHDAKAGRLAEAKAWIPELLRQLGHLNALSKHSCEEHPIACRAALSRIVVVSARESLDALSPFTPRELNSLHWFLTDLSAQAQSLERLKLHADAEAWRENLNVVAENGKTFSGLYVVGWVATLATVLGAHPEWTQTALISIVPAAALGAALLYTPFPKRMEEGDQNRVGEFVERSCSSLLTDTGVAA